jgi:hypothetical protein
MSNRRRSAAEKMDRLAERQSRRAPRLKCVPGNRPKLTKAQRKIVRESRRANR